MLLSEDLFINWLKDKTKLNNVQPAPNTSFSCFLYKLRDLQVYYCHALADWLTKQKTIGLLLPSVNHFLLLFFTKDRNTDSKLSLQKDKIRQSDNFFTQIMSDLPLKLCPLKVELFSSKRRSRQQDFQYCSSSKWQMLFSFYIWREL